MIVDLRLPKIYADYLRSEFGAQPNGVCAINTTNEIGKFILARVQEAKNPSHVRTHEADNIIKLKLPEQYGLDLYRHVLFISKKDQRMIYLFVRSLLYAKVMIWISISLRQGHSVKFAIEQFLFAHSIRNTAMNYDHLIKMTYRAELDSYKQSLAAMQGAVSQQYKKMC